MERIFICTIQKNVNLLLDPTPIKYLPDRTKILHSLIDPIIKEDECSDACIFVSHHYANRSSQIQSIYFDNSYSPLAHADSFRMNIFIADMHKLTDRILDSSNTFRNKNVPIHEIVCVSPPPYYIDWFEKCYPNATLNRNKVHFVFNSRMEFREHNHPDDDGFVSLMRWLQYINIIKETLIVPYTSRYYLMGLCPILQSLLMML